MSLWVVDVATLAGRPPGAREFRAAEADVRGVHADVHGIVPGSRPEDA